MVSSWAPNIAVKTPVIKEGSKAMSGLAQKGIKINTTVCFSVNQAPLAINSSTCFSNVIGKASITCVQVKQFDLAILNKTTCAPLRSFIFSQGVSGSSGVYVDNFT